MYNSGFGGQELFGNVWFDDGTWLSREEYDGSEWYTVNYVDFKSGARGEAMKIIKKYEAASDAAGTQKPQMFWFETGKYDMMVLWKFEEGPSDMEWKWSPRGIKWYQAFLEQEGSEEAAQKVFDEFDSLVVSEDSQIVRKDPR